MSTAAAAAAPVVEAISPKKGKKKLIIIVAAALALVLALAAGGYFLLKKKAPVDEDGDEVATSADKAEKADKVDKSDKADAGAAPKRDPKVPPAYVPLEMFTVNLADREVERYAQVGITLELLDAKDGEQIKIFMPAIRNNILMVLAHKTSQELLEREGKLKLAQEVQRAASRALGVNVKEPAAEPAEEDGKAKKKKAKKAEPPLPILAVHFSNFIVQ